MILEKFCIETRHKHIWLTVLIVFAALSKSQKEAEYKTYAANPQQQAAGHCLTLSRTLVVLNKVTRLLDFKKWFLNLRQHVTG